MSHQCFQRSVPLHTAAKRTSNSEFRTINKSRSFWTARSCETTDWISRLNASSCAWETFAMLSALAALIFLRLRVAARRRVSCRRCSFERPLASVTNVGPSAHHVRFRITARLCVSCRRCSFERPLAPLMASTEGSGTKIPRKANKCALVLALMRRRLDSATQGGLTAGVSTPTRNVEDLAGVLAAGATPAKLPEELASAESTGGQLAANNDDDTAILDFQAQEQDEA